MIELKNLSFYYEKAKEVIKDINLEIKKNEKITIIGKSGCGKSTLLFLLGAIYKPTSGEILFNGEILNTFRKDTSIIFQDNGLFPWKTVYQNLELGLKVRKIPKKEIEARIHKVLNKLGIEAYRHSYIKNLSGGQKQRVAIARSLVLNSDLLLLDEPSAALDAMTKDNFQETILNLYKNHELTSILVTHDLFEAVYLGEKIIIMKDGKIDRVINNELFGKNNQRNSIHFYEKCLEIKGMLEI